MIKTYGLTHISILVKDIHRSSAFYEKLFGAKKMYVTEKVIQLQTPGSHDIIVLDKSNGEHNTTNDSVLYIFIPKKNSGSPKT